MKNDNSCPNKHQFVLTTFNYGAQKYIKKSCKLCTFVSTEPFEGLSMDIYDSGHYEVKSFSLLPFLINLPDYLNILLILKFRGFQKNAFILDFGCGKGFFLKALKLMGYKNLYGLETSKARAEFSRKLTGLIISDEFYNSGNIIGKKYNLISLIHVLEHIPDPFLFLDNLILGAVENEGGVFIEVPNINSLSSLIAKDVWAHYTPHFHTNHFSVSSIKKYCIDRNLRYSLISTFSFYNSVMGMTSALLSIFGYSGSIFEDLKRKNIFVIFSIIIFLPFTLSLEFFISIFSNRGSVIKLIIYK
jgi:2-polyprenyl-3-methyl-5-hydroxy-6-metoxy-1,4-benzoquinol methylase